MLLAGPPVVDRRRALRSFLAVLAVGVAGCLAPTLPIPPPSAPDVSAIDADGNVHLTGGRGSAQPGAYVTVWNLRLDRGRTSRAAADGSWSETIPAQSKDVLYIWQESGNDRSDSIDVKVP